MFSSLRSLWSISDEPQRYKRNSSHLAKIYFYHKERKAMEHRMLINFGSYKFEIRKLAWVEGQLQRTQGAQGFTGVFLSALSAFFVVNS